MGSYWTRKPDFKNISLDVDYNDYWKHRGWEVNKRLKNREVIALDWIPKNVKAIDFGCGNSLLPVKMKEKGVDMSIADVSDEVLKGYGEYGITGSVVDLESDSLEGKLGNYDYILLFEVLEHIRYPEQLMQSLTKHAKNFVITVPNSACYFYRLHLMFKGRFFTQWTYHPSEHVRYWSHLDFLDWLDAMGLEIIKTKASDGFTAKGLIPSLPNLWKNFFAHRVVYHCRVKK